MAVRSWRAGSRRRPCSRDIALWRWFDDCAGFACGRRAGAPSAATSAGRRKRPTAQSRPAQEMRPRRRATASHRQDVSVASCRDGHACREACGEPAAHMVVERDAQAAPRPKRCAGAAAFAPHPTTHAPHDSAHRDTQSDRSRAPKRFANDMLTLQQAWSILLPSQDGTADASTSPPITPDVGRSSRRSRTQGDAWPSPPLASPS